MSGRPPKLTRRGVLAGAAVAGAGAVLRAPVSLAAGQESGRLSSRWIGVVRGTAAPIGAGRRFALAGVEWSSPVAARIELRARLRDGRWSPWVPASVQGHEPDGIGRPWASRFGEPVWLGAADAVQLRSASRVSGVRVHFVSRVAGGGVGSLGAAAELKVAAPVLDAGPGQPVILARSVWAGRHAPAAKPPYYGSVKLAFVHHTDNPNGYAPSDVPALLLAMFDYHRYVRGYRDIAYNFIIDAYGRIWEGRTGGIDGPVLGAHAGGLNAVSTGVAVLGTFMSSVPPPPALDALTHLLAWKLSLHGIPAIGRVGVRVNPSDAFYTPFRPDQLVQLHRVSGHRDGELTDCPGDAFYARLPSLRPRIAQLAGTPARLTAAVTREVVAPGTPVALAGTLALLSGQPIAGAPVDVQRLDDGVATTIGSVVTDASGAWTFPLTVARGLLLRALHQPAPASVSDVIEIEVAPVLTLAAVPGAPPAVTGTIAPPKSAVTLDTYQLTGRHKRRLLESRRIRVHGGRFTARAPGARPGRRLVVVARTTAGGGTLAGHSPAVTVGG